MDGVSEADSLSHPHISSIPLCLLQITLHAHTYNQSTAVRLVNNAFYCDLLNVVSALWSEEYNILDTNASSTHLCCCKHQGSLVQKRW